MRKSFLTDYFTFTKKERTGIIVLVAIIVFLFALPYFFPYFINEPTFDYSSFEEEIAQLKRDTLNGQRSKNYYENARAVALPEVLPAAKPQMVYFDPNVISTEEWIRLGVKEKTAVTIRKYVSKGGKFYRPEDLKKIWGLSLSDAERLAPYVKIQTDKKPISNFEKPEVPERFTFKKSISEIDVNTGDTTAFIALPGIGSRLAQRIIAFREKLGGFYSVNQVSETYFLPDSTFQKIKPYLVIKNPAVQKININVASKETLKSHPYFSYAVANAIIEFRNRHGKFSSLDQIREILIIPEDLYRKLVPYLTVD
jgi:competence protein ComEA